MKDLFNYYKNALSNGLCDEYKNRWRACGNDKDKLIKLVLSQQATPHLIDYCYKGLGVGKEYIQREFADYINGNRVIQDADDVNGYTYSLWVGYHGVFDVTTDVTTMMWVDKAHCTIPETKCPTIYIGCGSRVYLSLNGYNCPRIMLFDDSEVILYDSDEVSKVLVYRYSPKAKVEIGKYCLAEVKVFDKELRL